eukprot:TRINITY_DN28431_c0_g1_i1.p1 TRINITY_DN28431_c0_g1~~TRINITY_DN28431_c0_g1_i1.p1  ORF type:complete len:330 (-),score=62.59 TRINITY_DN28431_c0_g1_i1:199-1188(-)
MLRSLVGSEMCIRDSGVPEIDIGELVSCASVHKIHDRMSCVSAIRDACSRWGFFQITNHGVPAELIDRFYEQKMQFFNSPVPVKESVRRTATNSKGWYDDELTKQKRDWKQGFDFGSQEGDLEGRGLDGENQWPAGMGEFKAVMCEYYRAMEQLSPRIMSAMLVGLECPPGRLLPAFERHSSYLRMNWYPPCPDPSAHRAISEHTDAGALTILTQSNVQSLQVFHREKGRWFDVAPKPGAFVINTGDIMQVWSNDIYVAPLHRVKAQLSDERFSSPFFYNPSYDTEYAPLNETGPPKYRPINWGEFRMGRFQGDYADVGTENQISDYRI